MRLALPTQFIVSSSVLTLGIILGCAPACATPTVQVTTSVASPQPLGTTVALTATATDTDPGFISYRFEVGASTSSTLSIVRDYSANNVFNFTPTVHEGSYQFRVTARNNSTGKTAVDLINPFHFTRLVTGASPVVVATANPLVALFSAPPCATGSAMRVSFLRTGATYPVTTSWKSCNPMLDMNFLIAGMRADTVYIMYSQTWNGTSLTTGPALTFQTGTPSVSFPNVSFPVPLSSKDSLSERQLLIAALTGFPLAVEVSGQPIWYYVDPSVGVPPLVTRMVAGGTILMVTSGANSQTANAQGQQIVREIDLAGNTVRETNATRIQEQLAWKFGLRSSCQIGSTDCLAGVFHHEALRLPNGHTLVMSDEEKIFTDGTQGSSPTNPVDIIGDIILDLDTNFQLAWYWRAFDHLDANRPAVLGETCKPGGTGGCPVLFLTTGTANDWLHSNAIYYIASEGDLLMSMRHQDWVIKIDYQNEAGSSNVLWTLGLGGNFTINSKDPYPWFSHQHDVGFEMNGTTILSLFDNGNTRVAQNPGEHSRGYVLTVDETHMTVTPTLLADLGVYSFALGSAQRLDNGDYHFEAGLLDNPGPYSQSIEVFPNQTIGFDLQLNGSNAYRSFRVASLYAPPVK